MSLASDIPFRRQFALRPGVVDQVTPLVRRVLANNPGPFTFTGTVSYIVGSGRVAVIDPGPEDGAHIQILLNAVRHETITHILVTHTHKDHSPGARMLAQATGAPIMGCGPHGKGGDGLLEASADYEHKPDRILRQGERVTGPGWTLVVIETPGHTANHLCFALREEEALFCGDHVMGWSTPVIAPPDGNMTAYMDSLRKVMERTETVYFPGHGPALMDGPRFATGFLFHRQLREASILKYLERGAAKIEDIVSASYPGLDERLRKAASMTVFAHLEDLTRRGLVRPEGPLAPSSRFSIITSGL